MIRVLKGKFYHEAIASNTLLSGIKTCKVGLLSSIREIVGCCCKKARRKFGNFRILG